MNFYLKELIVRETGNLLIDSYIYILYIVHGVMILENPVIGQVA